jgi:hypothetical protein
MLTIVDLHQEEELSSSSMRKVAGGEEPIPGGGNGSRSGAGPEGPNPDLSGLGEAVGEVGLGVAIFCAGVVFAMLLPP